MGGLSASSPAIYRAIAGPVGGVANGRLTDCVTRPAVSV